MRVWPSRRRVQTSSLELWFLAVAVGFTKAVLFTFSSKMASAIESVTVRSAANPWDEPAGGGSVGTVRSAANPWDEPAGGGGVCKGSAEHAKEELEEEVPVEVDPANGEVEGRVKVRRGLGARGFISFWVESLAKLTSGFASSGVTANSMSKLLAAGSKTVVGFASPTTSSAASSEDSHFRVQSISECLALAPWICEHLGQRCHPRWHC